MTILQKPDALSLSGNIKEFRIGTTDTISFVLYQEEEEIVSRSYSPGADGIVIINIQDIVHARLSFLFKNTALVYEQTSLVSTFKAIISGTQVTFQAIRAGVDMLADSATNFLTQNFLTWQPNLKPVTYYSPEFLTYYATLACIAKLRAYFTNQAGSVISQSTISLAEFQTGRAYTIPLQYASVAEKLGNKMPAYYDVWVENQSGKRLTYIQRYYASDLKAETESWILFENSLGGIDTFRAYGSTAFTGEHTHNVAEIDEISLEYRIDTTRKFQKDTGYLNAKERTWLLDFFPSLKKYIYIGSFFRSIVVVESNVTYTDKELPSNYTFTYKYADAKPLLNLPRTDVPTVALDITVPEVGSFTVPPRLVEFPRLPLSEGALFPVQEPYSEIWGTTTTGSLLSYIIDQLSSNYGGGGGIGHQHANIDLLNLLSYVAGYLMIAGKKANVGYADEALSFLDDIARKLILFEKGLKSDNIISTNYLPGLLGQGACLKVDPITGKSLLEVDSAHFREELVVPKITFNCIDVVSGDKANTFAYGVIKNVDTDNCTAELDLLDDEIGTLDVGDIVRGILHNLEGGNVEEDFYDDNGFLNYVGFSTSYFTPLHIILSKPGYFKFKYSLKAGTTVHPLNGMRFYAYGNFYNKSRQSITYENRYYTRRLKNVNTWVINPTKNISMQDGLLEGLTIGGLEMHGYGTFMENCYLTGVQIQFTPEQKDEIKGEDAYSVNLSTYESVIVVDDENNLIGGLIDERFVTTGEEYVTSGDDNVTATLARLKTRIQAFRGSKEMYYSDEYHEDAYMVILNPVGCKAIVDNGLVVITEISDYDNCYVDIAVNCEGNCVFDKSYKITAVKNGTSVLYADLDNEMSSVSCDASGNVLFGLPVRTTVTMWYGNNELAVDKVEISLPDGVTGGSDKGNVTITDIDKSALSNLNIGITAYATYAGTQYHKQLTLVVNKIVPGENGQNAIIYNLNPSVNAIKIDKAGNYDVSSISCGLIKTDGASSISSSLPQGYVIKYTIDGGNAQTYTLGNNIDATKIEKKILFQILKGSTLIDQETIYVIADGHDGEPGNDGESSIYADLDNAITSVACSSAGEVLFGLPVSTGVNMWHGTEKLSLDAITVSVPTGVVYTVVSNVVKVTSIAASVSDIINLTITVKATAKGIQYTRELVFTINKVKQGEDGESPVLYDLKPSVSSVKVDKNNKYNPETISCKVSRTIATTTETLSVLPAGFSLYYIRDNSQTLVPYSYGTSLSLSGFNTSISFYLKHGEVIIDMETIFIIKDGSDGQDGLSAIYADLDNAVTSVACTPAGEVLFGLPVSTGVNMWYGTEKLSLDAITVAVPTGVVYTVGSNIVKVTSIAASVSDIINVVVTAKATYKGLQYSRDLMFTINKVKQGEDGESPVLYDLRPSASSVKVDKNNKYNPETISCKVSRTIATTTETLSVLPAGFSLYYTRDNSQTLVPYSYGTSLGLSGFNTSISFYLKHGEVIIDMETILIIKDGIDGGDGKDGGHTELRYKYAFGKPVAPTGINPRDWALSPDKEDIIPSFSGDFVKKGEYYVSPAPTSQSATYKQRVSFVTNKDNQVMYLEIDVSSETYDHGIVCALDTSYSTSAETLWNKGGLEKTIVEIVIPSAGSHFVDVVYVKDGSVDKYEDMFKFRILDPQICWFSTAVIEGDNPIIWSEPIIFPTDTPINEQIYLLARSELAVDMPASDQYVSEYIGDAPDYDNTRSYVAGNIVKYNNVYKVAMKAVTGIEPTGDEYWEDVEWWSDNPRGVSEVYPYEYTCERKFIQGRWEVYANYRLFMHYAKDGESAYQLIPSATQIMRTMTGNYEPSSFSVSHKDGKGNPVEAYVAVWGSQNGEEWTLVGSIVKISFRTINVAQYPYKYFVIRTYATASATWSSEYLLSASVNVIKDGEKGNSGAIPVYCGFYESDVEYTYTDTTRDIINYEIDGGVFTFQVKVHGATVTNPPTSSVGDANWETANKFKFVAMDTALIDGANIAGFMYKFLKMISRLGTLDNAEIDIKDVPASRIADFKPNLSMDGVTGKITCINADITGVINATEGYLGALKISGNRLSSEDLNSGIIIGNGKEGETGSGRFLRLGGGVNSSLIGIRLDRQNPLVNGHSGMSIESYGSKNVCLRLLANAGSKFAQDSVGPHRFYQREGEVWDSPGVLWSGRISANGTIENYWGNGCAVTSVYHGSKGLYALNHDIGHTNYFVQATAVHGEWSIAAITTKTRDQCTVMTFHKDGNYGDSAVEVTIIGRNRYKDY